MLTRLRFKRDFRLIVRCLSDKPSDGDGKTAEKEHKVSRADEKKAAGSTEKIQQLLKSMMTAKPKISESEYEKKFTVAPDRRRKQKAEDEIERKTEKIEESITKAAGDVAQAIGGDVKKTEAELLSKVLGKINQTSTSLSDLIIGMKVDRTKEGNEDNLKPQETRGQQVKRLVGKARAGQDYPDSTRFAQRKTRPDGGRREGDRGEGYTARKGPPQPISVDIFSGAPLGIFSPQVPEPNHGTRLDVWESLKQRELQLATAQPPANYFEKMIMWTEQGKVWKFPIDNEQGLEEEQSIHFSEHIFLDALLEDWCPKKGPIRHFMELVCVGLSKNAFYTVEEKRGHIEWYKEYFESKKEVLTEVGAWDQPPKTGSETSEASH